MIEVVGLYQARQNEWRERKREIDLQLLLYYLIAYAVKIAVWSSYRSSSTAEAWSRWNDLPHTYSGNTQHREKATLQGRDERKRFYVAKNFCQNVGNMMVTPAISQGHEPLQSEHCREGWLSG